MSLKAKIIVKLKAKATALGVNLSNVRINGLADKLDGLITNEDDIDGEIDKLDQVLGFKELAALDDAKRSAERRTAEEEDKDKNPERKDPVEPEKKDPEHKDEAPSWFKAHVENQNKVIETLTATVVNLQNGNTAQSRRQQLEAKLKDAPERFKTQTLRNFDRLKLDSEDDFTSYLAEVELDVADEIQAASDAGLGNDNPVRGAGGGKLKDDEVSPAMKEIVAQREAEAKAKAGA
ncbi:hypothetical protein E2P86_08530 [Sphingobacterium psychroaquaticum]|uniref:hypothetical protein n=1 Tax=Sphingobacterium psychroaquaticum TaxID=561061 RepID=UPI00106B8BCD|nr:hypothetical protein [Sphingobacterium psychroaquaticum]QBQ41199.1 hypothetical protein E2P86_08530 [Sphingobacterium psychroaquaticum]